MCYLQLNLTIFHICLEEILKKIHLIFLILLKRLIVYFITLSFILKVQIKGIFSDKLISVVNFSLSFISFCFMIKVIY
jgi:hypothetical protein